jgi:hypothetical protein
MLLLRIYVANENKTYLGLHEKCPIFLSDFNQICGFSEIHPVVAVLVCGQTGYDEANRRFSRLGERS